MNKALPSIEVIKGRLSGLNHAELHTLAASSNVPFPTLMKIRQGVTEDPRLGTVIKIMSHIPRARHGVSA